MNTSEIPSYIINVTLDLANMTRNTEAACKTAEEVLIVQLAKLSFGRDYAIIFPIVFLVCVLGLFTNALNIIVFTRPQMHTPPNFFLLCLSIGDIALILTQMPDYIHEMLGFRFFLTYIWNHLYISLAFLRGAAIFVVNWLSVAIGIWRIIALRWPLKTQSLCSFSSAKKSVAGILVGALVFPLTIYFIIECCEEKVCSGKTLYFVKFSVSEKHVVYTIYRILLPFFSLYPILFLVALTAFLVYTLIALKRDRKRAFYANQDIPEHLSKTNYGTMFLLIMLLVLTTLNNVPKAALALPKIFNDPKGHWYKSAKRATDPLRVFSMLSNSLSFFVYYFMGENFRNAFKPILRAFRYTLKPSDNKKNSLTMSAVGTTNTNFTSSGSEEYFELQLFS